MDRKRMIGIDRPVRIDWLDAAAARLAAGASERDTRAHLWNLLAGTVSGDTPQSARGKTMTVISRVWIIVPEHNLHLRARALELIESASPDERLASHWALMLGAYPFFLDLTSGIGKLLQLHGSFALAQLLRRMTDVWGDRSTLRPAVQRIVRMMVGWGVLGEGTTRGEFVPPHGKLRVSSLFSELLLEAILLNGNGSISVGELSTHPALFPFDTALSASELRKTTRFDVHREGGQVDIVELRRF